MSYFKYREYVRKTVTPVTTYLLLAEECAELSQAALKYVRAAGLTVGNPTPVSTKEASANVVEETGDVEMILDLMELSNADTAWNPKWKRWAERLGYEEEDENDDC